MKIVFPLIILFAHLDAHSYSIELCQTQEGRTEAVVYLMQGPQNIKALNYGAEVYEKYKKDQEYIDFSDEMKSYLDGVFIIVRDFQVSVQTSDILRYSQLYKIFLKDHPGYFPSGLSAESADEEVYAWMNSGGFFTSQQVAYAAMLKHLDELGALLSDEEVQKKLEIFQEIETQTCTHFADIE